MTKEECKEWWTVTKRRLSAWWERFRKRYPDYTVFDVEFTADHPGIPVGEPLTVRHPTFHDMRSGACMHRLRDEVIRTGMDVNALVMTEFKRLDDHPVADTTFQPLKIEG